MRELFNLIKDFFNLLLSILTFLPSPINKIAIFYIGIIISLTIYKLVRRILI